MLAWRREGQAGRALPEQLTAALGEQLFGKGDDSGDDACSSLSTNAHIRLASVPDRDLPAVCHLRGSGEAESIAVRDPCGAPRRGCRVE